MIWAKSRERKNMALVPFKPFSTLARWPDIWDEDEFSTWVSQASNNLDVYETDDLVVIKANVAGTKAENVDLTFEDGVLWIKAHKVEKETTQDKKHYSKSSWEYSYKVAVPGKIDYAQEPKAELEDGVLTVTFEKAENVKPKSIKVKAKK